MAELVEGTCTREGCENPTVDDSVCWWCRNEDAGTPYAEPDDREEGSDDARG